jgi:hypothetical protein
VNGARILKPDAVASNGVIHFVNRVLYPFAEKNVVDIMFGCKTFEGEQITYYRLYQVTAGKGRGVLKGRSSLLLGQLL